MDVVVNALTVQQSFVEICENAALCLRNLAIAPGATQLMQDAGAGPALAEAQALHTESETLHELDTVNLANGIEAPGAAVKR